jgi:protease-4
LKKLLYGIHKEFINDIKNSRKDKIIDKKVFSGLFWTGSQAIEMGLVDEIASIYDVNELYFENRLMIIYNKKPNILDNIFDTMINSLTQINASSLVY